MVDGWGGVRSTRLSEYSNGFHVLPHNIPRYMLGEHVGGVTDSGSFGESEVSFSYSILYPDISNM